MRRLIINADDFGFTAGINRGIRKALTEGVVSSISVMPNLPWAEEIKDIANQFPRVSIGYHLNLTKGRPLLPPERVNTLVESDGFFLNRPSKLAAAAELKQMEEEIRAQLEKILSYGIRISHLDSHHHLHYHPKVLPLAVKIAKEYGIKAIRYPDRRFFERESEEIDDFAWEYFYPQQISGDEYFKIWQRGKELIDCAGLQTADGYIPDFFTKGKIGLSNLMQLLKNLPIGISELICHPGEVDEELSSVSSYTVEREIELYTLTLPGLRTDLEELEIKLVSHWSVSEGEEEGKC